MPRIPKAAVLGLIAVVVLIAQSDLSSIIVYRTQNGAKYHRTGCTALRRSKIKLTLGEAVKTGLEPCLNCNPPVLPQGKIVKERVKSSDIPLYRVNLAGVQRAADASVSRMLNAVVIRHIDGDTVRLHFDNPPPGIKSEETIRMIGVDTPETVHPTKAVEFFGKEASDWTKKQLLNRPVYVAFDWDTRDKYGRLLVYLYTASGNCHNAELIKQGYAHAYTRFPFQFLDEFRAFEQEARAAKHGLWRQEAR